MIRSSVRCAIAALVCVALVSAASVSERVRIQTEGGDATSSSTGRVQIRAFPRWRSLKDTAQHTTASTANNAAPSLVERRASTQAATTATTTAKEGEMDYDSFFTGEHDRPQWLLTNNRDANPFRSLTPYGQVNPHNPLATLIPPKDAVTVDNNPNFRFMGEYNPNREAVKPYDLETHAILAFLELKSEELSRKAAPSAAEPAFAEPISLVEVDAKYRDDDDYNGVGGNANNAFYGAGGKGPAWVLPVEPIGGPFRSRTGVPMQNIKPSDVAPVQTPPMGVASAEPLSPEDRYMPLFDRPSSAYGAGPFSFLEIERHEKIVELQKEFEQWFVSGGHEVAKRRMQAHASQQQA